MSHELAEVVWRSCFAGTEPLYWVYLEQSFNKVSRLIAHLDALWPLVLHAHNLDEQVGLNVRLKRQLPCVHIEKHDTEGPQVTPWHCFAIREHLRRDIKWRSDEGLIQAFHV